MASLIIKSLTLISCWMMITQCKTNDIPKIIVDLLTACNGYYVNSRQFDEHIDTYDLVETYAKPVIVPSLDDIPMLCLIESVNHRVYRFLILKLTASPDGKTVYLTPYNVTTDQSQYKAENINVDDLSNRKREDFKIYEECQSNLRETSPGAFAGIYTDCNHQVGGVYLQYHWSFDCDDIYFNSPVQSFETTTILSYDLKFKGKKYPVPGVPKDSTNLCQGTK